MKNGLNSMLKNTLPCLLLCFLLAPAASLAQVNQAKYLAYDIWGNPTEVQDAMGVKTAYDWSADGSMIVGIFTNAQASDVFAHSFAYDGLKNWAFVDNGSDGDTEASISGGKLNIKNFASAVNGEFDRIYYNHGSEVTQSVVWEFDVQIANSNSWDLQMNAGGSSWNTSSGSTERAVWSAINNESWRTHNGSSWVTLKSGLTIGKTYGFKIVMHPGSNSADYYLNGEQLATGIPFRNSSSGIQKVAFGNYGYSSVTTEWMIDNVRIYPEAAQATSQEAAPLFGNSVALKDEAGSTRRFDYDDFGRLVATINENGKLTEAYGYGYSQAMSGGGYDPDAPNHVESIQYNDPQYYTDLTSSSGWGMSGTGITFNISTKGETTVRMGTDGGYDSIYRSVGSSSVIARFDFFPDNSTGGTPHLMLDSSGHRFGLHYIPSGDYFRIQYRKNSGSWTYPFSFPLDAPPNRWYTIELEKNGSELTAWVYPKGQGRDDQNAYSLGGFDSGWVPNLRFWSNDNYYYLANVSYARSWQSGITYLDGLGREIQTQQRGGSSTLITGTLYNERGLPEVSSRPIEKASQTTYLSTLFDGTGTFTPGSALPGSSPIEDYYQALPSNDEDYAYHHSAYEDSPLARVSKSTLPGPAHKMGSGREVSITYGLNTTETFATGAQGSTPSKSWAANELQKTITEDPDGKQTITYTDGWGQTIASGVDMNTDGKLTRGSADLVTEFSYDLRGNLVRTEDSRGLITSYDYTISAYNPQGQLVEKKLADQTHPHKFRYDKKGRLRFHRDPNQDAASDHYYYTKYDELDRPTETGSYNSSSGFDNTTNLNNPGWPTSGHTPLTYHHYDGTNAYSGARNLKGRLTRARYKDLDTGGWGYTWYSYNELGLVEWVVQRLPGLSGDHKIEYSYDELGRTTRVFYNPTGTGNDHYTWYYYDELGRLDEVASHTTSSEGSAQTEAAWSYGADGQPTQLVLGSTAQTVDYLYSVQGWTDRINNPSSMGSDKFATDLYYHYNGNISRQRWEQAGISTSTYNYYYHYDNANRLSEACYGSSTCDSGAFDVTYNYDKNGNIEDIHRNRNSGTVDHYNPVYVSGTNIIDYVSFGGTKQFSNDANGNITVNAIQGITATSYDWRNLPYQVSTGSATMYYGYDAGGQRVRKEVNGGTEMHYVRGAGGETVAVYKDGSREFVNLLAGSEIIGTWDGTERRYFLKDHLGSVRTTVDASGNVDGYDDYYAFGLVMPGRSSNTGNPNDNYKFTGHERDDEAGLTLDYMMARNYDPIIGRFLQIDPLTDQFPGWTPYHYVHNNPLGLVDPTGMAACDPPQDCSKRDFAPSAKNIFYAQMNSAKEQVASIPRFFKAKALQLSASLGFGTEKTGSADVLNASGQLTMGADGVNATTNFSAGAVSLDSEEGVGVAIPGLLTANPETGSFDAAIPFPNGISMTLSHNTESGDVGGGADFGIGKLLSAGFKVIINFNENVKESKERISKANERVDNAMVDVEVLNNE